MAKGNAGKAAPAKVMSGQNRPNGKAYKKFIKTMVFDERRGRHKLVRVPNPKG